MCHSDESKFTLEILKGKKNDVHACVFTPKCNFSTHAGYSMPPTRCFQLSILLFPMLTAQSEGVALQAEPFMRLPGDKNKILFKDQYLVGCH